MRALLLFLIFSSIFSSSQVIKDSILGKPKFVKEYVVFLNNSGPFTFMKGDDEYGHAVIMTPKNLRSRMRETWFETDFCRYINNETNYDKNRNITKETWYYKSGEIVDNYDYTFDSLNRLIEEKRKNKYSEISYHYFYNGNNKNVKFKEAYYKTKDKHMEKYISNLENFKPLYITKFDTLTRTDSIFTITNEIWKKEGERSYTEFKDSIFHKKLNRVKIYDNQYRVIEEKSFDHKLDYENKKIFLSNHMKYKYDKSGNLIQRAEIKDGKYHYYTILEKGKIITEEKDGNYEKPMSITYTYTKDQKLERTTAHYNNNIWYDIQFEYKGNYITNMTYLNKIGMEDKNIVPKLITFKYKFDKQKNWIEMIKNVDGKDLYKWVREIEYYR